MAPNYEHNCVRIIGFCPPVCMKLPSTVRLTDAAIASTVGVIVSTHLDSLAQFDSESKRVGPNMTQVQVDSFWPNLTLLL